MSQAFLRRAALVLAAFSCWLVMVLFLLFCSIIYEPQTYLASEMQILRGSCSELFPRNVEGTPFVAVYLASYDGEFWEDGSGENVFDVSALLLINTSSSLIEETCVKLDTLNGQLVFWADMIPPGASILVPELNKTKYQDYELVRVSGWVRKSQAILQGITVTEIGMADLIVTNHASCYLHNVILYHKDYLPEADMYIGGRSHVTFVKDLPPQTCILVYPECYASGYSRVICCKNE